MPEAMRQSLKNDAFIFSGLKTNAQLLEAHSYLLDNDGNKKPYLLFEKDILKLNETYNTHYLEAEYQFATSSAQMAAKWANYEADGERYNLQYRTANDERVRASHALLHNITLPLTDSFWDSYFPPNGWRCRCTTVQVRKGKYEESDSADALAKADTATTQLDKNGNNKLAMFRFNSGKQKVLMPPDNAYSKVAGASKVKEIANVLRKETAIENKRAIYAIPIEEQYQPVFKNKKTGAIIEAHKLANKKQVDYKEVMYGAKAWTQEGKSARIQPTIHKSEIEARKKVFPNYNNPNSNPDLLLNDGSYIDIKSPENTGNIVHLANKANRQGAEACITDYKYKFDEDYIKQQAERIFNNKDKGEFTYNMDRVHFVIKGKIHTFDNPRKN